MVDLTAIPIINPLAIFNQLIVLVVLVILVFFIYKFWDRILLAFTGDDRIHGTFLDFVWFGLFRCCGLCSGDWTRWISRCCLCPKSLRGANLIKRFGQTLGLTPSAIELKNIAVGDLPWPRRANFYIQVECAANPPMRSSVVESAAKVVHFPEILTLRLRYSPLEEKVRITVKELNLFGSTDLCTCSISAMHLMDWAANPRQCMKRIEMTSCLDRDLQWETQSWILCEFGEPHDDRDLENFHAMGTSIRTATRDGLTKTEVIKDFKHDYTLLDASGHVMAEPLEEDLEGIECRMRLVSNCHWAITCWGTIFFAAAGLYDIYLRSCWKRFDRLTKARLNNATMPVNTATLFMIDKACKRQVEGLVTKPGVPCVPSNEQIMDTCTPATSGGRFPPQQPQMYAMEGFIEFHTGQPGIGILCTETSCTHKEIFQQFDAFLGPAFVVFLLFTVCCRLSGNGWVKNHQVDVQQRRLDDTRRIREDARKKQGTSKW